MQNVSKEVICFSYPCLLGIILWSSRKRVCRIRQQGDGQAADLDDSQRLPPLSSVELKVGVLHYDPGQEPFPLLSQPTEYVPDTIDITERTELTYWVKILSGQIPIVAEKAIATDGGTDGE